MSLRTGLASLVALLAVDSVASCPVPPARLAEALSLARQLATDQHADRALSCIDAALAAHLGSATERAGLQLELATWLESVGRYAEARARLQAATELLPKSAGPHQHELIAAEAGWLNFRLGDFESAEHALSVLADGSSLSPLEQAIVLDHLGIVQRERSRYLPAARSFAQALDLAQRGPPDAAEPLQARIHNDRGGLRSYQSEFRAALEDFQYALGIYRRRGMGQTLEAARVLNNLGNAHRELGELQLARTELEQALELKTALLGPQNTNTASTLSNLGMVAEQAQDYIGARAYYARALAIYQKELGANHANVASVAAQYGRLQFADGKYPQALELLERARSIREREFGYYSSWSAETLVDLVPLYSRLGRHVRARHSAERALAIAVVSREQELLYDGYMSYARALAAERQVDAAIFFGKRAINAIQQLREHEVVLSRRAQQSFLAPREAMYRDLADWLVTVGRLPEAEHVLDLLKSEELANFAGLPMSTPDSLSGRVGMVREEVAAAAALDRAVEELSVQLGDSNEPTATADAAHARFIERLRALTAAVAGPTLPARKHGEPAGLAMDTLPDMAVIRYLVLPGQLRILVHTSAGLTQRSVPVERAELNREVLALHDGLRSRLPAEDAAGALFRRLIAPISPVLVSSGLHHLVLIPDDILRYVPFAALHDGHKYLIESYALSIGTPAAERTDATARPLRTAAAFGVSRAPDGTVLLPNVPVELRRVVRASPLDHTGALPGVILLDGAFTRASAARALASGPPVVHIASHFVFRPGALAGSYLLLGDGTHLTLDMLKTNALPLSGVEMLTLSACDTAIGELQADGREIESFAALVQRQGVRSVLATLWSVPDLSTSVVMAKFYGELTRARDSPAARAEALRGAQLLLLKGPFTSEPARSGYTPRSPYADPFFWAAFTLLSSPT
jgi:CHAT domain-containing protein/tetratricopeptide (TPR) repeat protein